jgi:hypothetical protein
MPPSQICWRAGSARAVGVQITWIHSSKLLFGHTRQSQLFTCRAHLFLLFHLEFTFPRDFDRAPPCMHSGPPSHGRAGCVDCVLCTIRWIIHSHTFCAAAACCFDWLQPAVAACWLHAVCVCLLLCSPSPPLPHSSLLPVRLPACWVAVRPALLLLRALARGEARRANRCPPNKHRTYR